MSEKIVVIGGGLSGLTAAYALNKYGHKVLLIEAGERLGGRVYSKSKHDYQFELGATWVFQDPVLKQLIAELGLDIYPQYLSGDALIKYEPSMATQKIPTGSLMNGAEYHKVKGGTGAIIDALAKELEAKSILLNSIVDSVSYMDNKLSIILSGGTIIETASVIMALPPKMIVDQINFNPQLESYEVMHSTQTWMGESAKFTVIMDQDYWRKNNLSGFVYSNYGIVREMQDHQTPDGQSFGLVGFIQPPDDLLMDFESRKRAVVEELIALFDIKPENILAYDDCLWKEHYVDSEGQNYNADLMPHQNNGHDVYLKGYYNNRLFFAGAETSPTNPGYMEGAVTSAYRAVQMLLDTKGKSTS